jgi:hypothetical protein
MSCTCATLLQLHPSKSNKSAFARRVAPLSAFHPALTRRVHFDASPRKPGRTSPSTRNLAKISVKPFVAQLWIPVIDKFHAAMLRLGHIFPARRHLPLLARLVALNSAELARKLLKELLESDRR